MKVLLGNKTPTKDFPLQKPFLFSSLSKHPVLPERCHSTQPCFSISLCVCLLLSLPWRYGLPQGRVGVCLLAALAQHLAPCAVPTSKPSPFRLPLSTVLSPARKYTEVPAPGSQVLGARESRGGGAGLTLGVTSPNVSVTPGASNEGRGGPSTPE